MLTDRKPSRKRPLAFEEFMPLFKEALKRGKIVFTFDLDQVLANTAETVVSEYNQRFGGKIRWDEDVKTWFPLTSFLVEKGLSEDEAMRLEMSFWKDPGILLRAQPLWASLQFFNDMTTYSFGRTHIITTRVPELREITYEWLDRWWISRNPFFIQEQVWIRRDDKESGEDFKIHVINGISNGTEGGIVIHIDDSPEICSRVLTETKAIPILLQSTVDVQNNDNLGYPVVPRRETGGQILLDLYSLFIEGAVDLGI